MCVGKNCDGSPLTVQYVNTSAVANYPVVNLSALTAGATAPSYPIVMTLAVSGSIVGKMHDCPSCNCVSVQP